MVRALAIFAFFSLASLIIAQEKPSEPKAKDDAKSKEKELRSKLSKLPEGSKAIRDIAYIPMGGPRQTLDLFLPARIAGNEKPVPLIMYIHGGGWEGGKKEQGVPLKWLSQGYAVASINYRLTNLGPFPAQIQDCKEAVRWLRSHAADYNLDPNRFGAFGPSAGGHLVSLLATTGDETFPPLREDTKQIPTKVHAVCNWFGPADFMDWDEIRAPAIFGTGPIIKLFGGPVQEKQDLARAASPVTYANKDASPLLIIHGDRDPLVPLKQSENLYKALTKVGAEAKLHIVKGAGHGNGFLVPEIFEMMDKFFDSHLKTEATK